MHVYLAVALATLLASYALTPCAIRLAHVLNWVDNPGLRKIHSKPVAYLGGAAIFAALCLGFLVLLFVAGNPAGSLRALDPRMLSLVAGAALVFTVGLVDDVRGIRPRVKLAAQIIAALAVCASGITIDQIHITENLVFEFGSLSPIVTILWIVGITNAVNLIDGMDGLATGLSIVASAAIGWMAYQSGLYTTAIMMTALFGALLGFLPYNLNPAKIFLGDAGSMLLGFLLSATPILSTAKAATLVGVSIPLVALGIPILDTLFSMVRRVLEGRSLFSADRNHIHHRLIALGFSQTRIVFLLCAATAFAVVLVLSFSAASTAVRNTIIVAVFGLLVLLFRAVGAVRFRSSFTGLSRILVAAEQAKGERTDLDDLELQFREATSVGDWWQGVCKAATVFGFSRLEFSMDKREQGTELLAWTGSSDGGSSSSGSMRMTVPVCHRRSDVPIPMLVEIPTAESLEVAGRRMSLFCRLMDRYNIAQLPAASGGEPKRTANGLLKGFLTSEVGQSRDRLPEGELLSADE